MSRFSAFCLITAVVATGFTACNSSSDDLLNTQLPSSTMVKSFSLSEDTKVLDNLDKVFFSIDLNTANIFNADSLPYGTDVHALVPVITTGGVSALEIHVPRPNQSDTIHNYLENPTDSIDFSNGPVTLHLKSIDETASMTYTVSVNVHKVKSDSLAWGNAAYSKLPTSFSAVTEQHTVRHNGKAYCLTSDGTDYCMAISDNPATEQWQLHDVTFGFLPNIESLRSTSEALYILSIDGQLYKSVDDGKTWSDTGAKYDYLIGGFGENLIGTVKEGSQWNIVSTAGKSWAAPADFPVSGTSTPIEYTFPMSDSHQFTIVGGCLASGALTGASWGFDGNEWASISMYGLPDAVEEMMVVPYFIFSENDFFVATKSSIFVAFGGKMENGKCNNTVYISYNYGMTWKKASVEMQLPSNVPAMYAAQALVFPQKIDVSGSRVSTEITSWECPYIYVFGGMNSDNVTYDTVWRAVINRMMFKPIQ